MTTVYSNTVTVTTQADASLDSAAASPATPSPGYDFIVDVGINAATPVVPDPTLAVSGGSPVVLDPVVGDPTVPSIDADLVPDTGTATGDPTAVSSNVSLVLDLDPIAADPSAPDPSTSEAFAGLIVVLSESMTVAGSRGETLSV